MEPSCPRLLLEARAGFTNMTLRHSNSPSNGKDQTHRPNKARQVKSEVKNMPINFFGISGTVYKEFDLAGQTISSHTTVTFYGDYLKMCEDFTVNFGN
jgi:hypothetical protein